MRFVLLHGANVDAEFEGVAPPIDCGIVDEAVGIVDANGMIAQRIASESGNRDRVRRLTVADILISVSVKSKLHIIQNRRREMMLKVDDGVGVDMVVIVFSASAAEVIRYMFVLKRTESAVLLLIA